MNITITKPATTETLSDWDMKQIIQSLKNQSAYLRREFRGLERDADMIEALIKRLQS